MTFRPWIFVVTNFSRINEPIFALAFMEHKRRLELPDDVALLPLHQQVKHVSKFVKDHYLKNKGKLPMWREIQKYSFYWADNEAVVFSPDGNIIGEYKESAAPPASLTVKGKDLTKIIKVDQIFD